MQVRTGSVFWGFMSNVSVYDVGLHFGFVFTHENIIFAQCLFVNVNLLILYVCVRVCVIMGEHVCVHACAHILLWRCVSSVCLILTGHISCWGRGGGGIVVALSQVCG